MLDISPDVAPPQPVRLADYRPPAFLIDPVDLVFELGEVDTRVKSRLRIRRNPEVADLKAPLHLDGEELELVSLALDGEPLGANRYQLPPEGGLILTDVADAFTRDVDARVSPEGNTALSGLYMSGGNFWPQRQPEGFRRITSFIDRPDVMARYTTTIAGDKARFPVLLSNGNPVERGEGDDGRYWAKWVDQHPKPSYLFALVAGDLVAVRDRFTTRSGKEVALAIWVRRGDEDKCGHAMASLKKAMRWDEEVFGLEYDLEIFNIVAVSDFNMGAMENKGLNIFNTRYVLKMLSPLFSIAPMLKSLTATMLKISRSYSRPNASSSQRIAFFRDVIAWPHLSWSPRRTQIASGTTRPDRVANRSSTAPRPPATT